MVIYKITNIVNGKVYIGQTKELLSKRFLGHCHCKSHRSHISSAIIKYGRENFTIDQIDQAQTQEELDNKEIYWISFYDSINRDKGYNILPGGSGRKHTEESKKKMSESRKGRRNSPEAIERTRLSNIGRKRKEGTGAKISAALKGKKRGPIWTEEQKKEIGQRNKGKKHTEETIQKMKESQAKQLERKKAYVFTEEHKQKLREARAKQIRPKKNLTIKLEE